MQNVASLLIFHQSKHNLCDSPLLIAHAKLLPTAFGRSVRFIGANEFPTVLSVKGGAAKTFGHCVR